jgi:hypothetical protein
LGGGREAGREAEVELGRLVGVGHENDLGDGRRGRLNVETAAPHAVEDGPADLPHAVARGLRDEGGLGVVAVALERGGQARIDDAEDGLEASAVGFDGAGVGGGRGKVARPARGTLGDGFGDLAFGEGVGAIHQARGEIGFGPVERGG